MIYSFLFVLAIAAQINAYGCNQQTVPVNCGSCSQKLPPLTVSNSGNGGVITRNIVVKGKYPVKLCNCGPTPEKQIPVVTSHVQAPVQEKPTVRLPARIPAPKTISHTCTCYKTILRPRVHQQIITVPTVQRYIETTHKPVVENIHYEGCPVNCEPETNCKYQAVEVPACGASTCEISSCGNCGTCGVSTCGTSSCETCVVPTCETSSCGSCGTCVIPTCGTSSCGNSICGSCGVSTCGTCGFCGIPTCAVQVPTCQAQTIEIPPVQTCQQSVSFGCSPCSQF